MGAPWFKLYAKDYLGDPDVRRLTDADRGILVDLWAIQTQLGGIPKDPETLGKLLHKRPDHALRALSRVSYMFDQDPLNDGLMVSLRLQSEQGAYYRKVLSSQVNGTHGGRPKNNPVGFREIDVSGNPTAREPEPELEKDKTVPSEPKTEAIKKITRKPKSPPPSGDFEDILGAKKGEEGYDQFWELKNVWPTSACQKLKDTARAYVVARKQASHACILAQAEYVVRKSSRRVTTLAMWLDQQPWDYLQSEWEK